MMDSEPTSRRPAPRAGGDPAACASNRERLIQVAAVLFHDEGYHHVSLDRVLDASGVARSNFYYHFRSKEDLAIAVMDTWLERLRATVVAPALADPSLPALERVRRILDGLLDQLEVAGCRGGCPFGSLANAEAEHNERFRQKLVETFDGFARMLEALFAEAAAQGAIDDRRAPVDLAAATLALVQGGFLLTKTYAGATPMRIAVRGLLELLGVDPDARRAM